MFQKMKLHLQKGISLLEVMLSLSIIAIILVMATRYFFSANTTQKINQEVVQMGSLNSAIEKWKTTNSPSTYPTDLTWTMVSPMDPSWDATTGIMKNLWGDTMTLTGSGGTTYTITMTLPSASVCSSLAASFANGVAACVSAAFTYTGPAASG